MSPWLRTELIDKQANEFLQKNNFASALAHKRLVAVSKKHNQCQFKLLVHKLEGGSRFDIKTIQSESLCGLLSKNYRKSSVFNLIVFKLATLL